MRRRAPPAPAAPQRLALLLVIALACGAAGSMITYKKEISAGTSMLEVSASS